MALLCELVAKSIMISYYKIHTQEIKYLVGRIGFEPMTIGLKAANLKRRNN